MARINRLLEITDLITSEEASDLFDAADAGWSDLRAAVMLLTQYSVRRRWQIFRAVLRLKSMSSSSVSSSSSSSSTSGG